MSQEVMIAGALFSDVPSIRVPDSHGNFHPFTDTSDADASAEDIMQGKTAYVGGEKIVGAFQPAEPIETEALTVTENGVYTASSGHAYTPVTVNVAGGGGISVDDLATDGLTGNLYLTVSNIRSYAFYSQNISAVDAPNVVTIGSAAFMSCSRLTTASFPAATSICSSAFQKCSSLTTASFPAATSIGSYAFRSCTMLTELHLDSVPSVPTLGVSVFLSTPIGGYSASARQYGSVFVPASLYESFLTAANWSSIASRIVSV